MAGRRIDIPRDVLARDIQDMTTEDIAEKFGCSPATILNRIKEYGLDGSTGMGKVERGVGIDIGTMNIVAARKSGSEITTQRIRDAFLDLDIDAKKMLKLSGVSFIEYEDRILILGDAALETANLFNREARRPLSKGLVSSSEMDALEVLSIMISQVLGDPGVPGEPCYYSIPANPLDNPSRNVTYHEAIFAKILEELGYTPVSGNEAMAIIYAECSQDQFSGIGVSYGAGMTNVAMSYKTMPILEFSLERGGDWLDENAATAVGTTASRMCAIKEKGVDLTSPQTREEEALVVYYKSLIKYTLDNIARQFKVTQKDTELKDAMPIIVSGGTSKSIGFLDVFKDVFEKQRKSFPIEISEIRQARDPMTAVAQGLLIQALADDE
jgi:hypothetical protein